MSLIRTHTNVWYFYYMGPMGQMSRAHFTGSCYQDAINSFNDYINSLNTSALCPTQVTRLYIEHDQECRLVGTGESIIYDMLLAADADTMDAYEQIIAGVDERTEHKAREARWRKEDQAAAMAAEENA